MFTSCCLTLADLEAGVRSAPEAEARDLVIASRLPEPLWNHDLFTPDGTWIARPDGWWKEGVAFEVDSREYHFSEADWQATMLRHERLSAYGIIAIHASPSRIRRHGRDLAGSIRAALRNAAAHPPPHIVALPPGSQFRRPA